MSVRGRNGMKNFGLEAVMEQDFLKAGFNHGWTWIKNTNDE